LNILDDEELLRCITPNEKEDFLLMSKKALTIRTFTNTARKIDDKMNVAKVDGDKMNVELCRKIKIVETPGPADQENKTNL
jgi:hypothetical protein